MLVLKRQPLKDNLILAKFKKRLFNKQSLFLSLINAAMSNIPPYLFTSARLGFRRWQPADLQPMAALNTDPEVMRYFPALQSEAETAAFISRMDSLMDEKGYCYYAVDNLDNGAFIGFTGFATKSFPANFTPCIDIGWRLARAAWGRGFATEAAKACLHYGWDVLGLTTIYAIAPEVNTPSIRIMEKIGMQHTVRFLHPQLAGNDYLQPCVAYLAHNPLFDNTGA